MSSNRWLSKIDIAAAIRARNIFNSMVKRGEVEQGSNRHVVCGCGEEGCVFITRTRGAQNN